MELKKYGTWETYVEEVLSWFAAGPSKNWTTQRRRERAYAALCQYHCDRRHEAELRGKLAGEVAEKDARIADLEALLRSLEWSGGHGPEAACPSCGEDYPLHDSECRLMAALPPQEEAN